MKLRFGHCEKSTEGIDKKRMDEGEEEGGALPH